MKWVHEAMMMHDNHPYNCPMTELTVSPYDFIFNPLGSFVMTEHETDQN